MIKMIMATLLLAFAIGFVVHFYRTFNAEGKRKFWKIALYSTACLVAAISSLILIVIGF